MCDPSMATKMTVQFNLFGRYRRARVARERVEFNICCHPSHLGGTVLKLGTEVHHDALLKKMDTLEAIGRSTEK